MTTTLPTTSDDPPTAAGHRDHLAQYLARSGAVRTLPVHRAFQQIPRHRFAPHLAPRTDDALPRLDPERTRHHEKWLQRTYQDHPIVTRRDAGGTPTSAVTRPSLAAQLLELAGVEHGHRVLEIGVGSGWVTAMICHLTTPHRVIGLDIDASLLDDARVRLSRCGYRPILARTDGRAGWYQHAPYDRIVAGCGVDRVPAVWLTQARPGVIAAIVGGALIGLRVDDTGHAVGRFTVVVDDVVPARYSGAPPAWSRAQLHAMIRGAWEGSRPAGLLLDMWDERFAALAAVAVPGLRAVPHPRDDLYGVVDPVSGSWARCEEAPGGPRVRWVGPRRLWDDLEEAHAWWSSSGCPALHEVGLTVDPGGRHTLWVGQPGQCELPLP